MLLRPLLQRFVNVLILGLLPAWAAPAPAVNYPVFLDLRPGHPAAPATWLPSGGAPPATEVMLGDTPAARLHCRFSEPTALRAAWDIPVSLDLSLSRGIRFQIWSSDPAALSHCTLYFRSADGWYAVPFSPGSAGSWTTVEVLKAASRPEGQPAGWQRIDLLRLAFWRGSPVDTTMVVAGFGVIHPNTPVAVIRGMSAVAKLPPGEAASVYAAAERVAAALDAYGVNPAFMDDTDVSARTLHPLRLVILPFNPDMPADVAQALGSYLDAGGRVIGFYVLPETLQAPMGMRTGRYMAAREFNDGLSGLALDAKRLAGAPAVVRQASWNIFTAQPLPGRGEVLGTWLDGTGARTDAPAVVASDRGLWMTHTYLAQDRPAGDRLILALAGHCLPEVWRVAALSRFARLGGELPYADPFAALKSMAAAGTGGSASPAATAAVAEAEALRAQGMQLLGTGAHVAALQRAEAADRALEKAFFLVQRPVRDEFRAAWIHRGTGIEGWTWDETVRQLAAGGFNVLLANLASADRAFYPSAVLPVDPVVATQGDQLAAAAAACRRHGVSLHVWKVCFRRSDSPDAGLTERLRGEGRLFVASAGRTDNGWLCPSHPENQRLEIAAAAEAIRNYPSVAGYHLDYIRYPGADGCFCAGCRSRFEAASGRRIADWPADVGRDPGVATAWRQFRRDTISTVVRGVRQATSAVRADVQLSAAVFPNWSTARESLAQDWVAWCRAGYLDFVCPMNYFPDPHLFEAAVRRQAGWLQGTRTRLHPGIGLTTEPLTPAALVAQVMVTRNQRTGGFTLFELNRSVATDILPLLGQGLTRPEARAAGRARE